MTQSQATKLIEAIRQHGHEAYPLPNGNIQALMNVCGPDHNWFVETSEIKPQLRAVRDWLGY